jgi:hypothetical protein
VQREIADAVGPGGDGARRALRDDARLPGRDDVLAAVVGHRRRPRHDDQHDVALVVHMAGRAPAGRPGEERRVQVLRRRAPHGPGARGPEQVDNLHARARSARQRRGEERVLRHEPLEEREQLALLEPDVRLDGAADRAHETGIRGADRDLPREAADESAGLLMLHQRADEHRPRRLLVGHQREQELLLVTEVRARVLGEEPQERPRGIGPRRLAPAGVAPEPACRREVVAMVVQQRDERRVPLHRLERSAAT